MKRSKPVYKLSGEALDQETIIRLRPKMEDYVREDLGKTFRKTDLKWNMNDKNHFTFTMNFYA
jgi:hypothetical protein